ncbi:MULTISPECIES: LysE family translocator [Cetobacterium]|uniref:LysE family transporter n=1 Tax=Candidatus Cetobacterium colombiensis TaxID=3073100 RepID=A0ABU4WBM2_9FUSO|nr:LysE family transporter [Candidatus Cetobacterium colombiensis]MDX8336916.1 LysE family transporter [Candidatus Cetobacterium colombiensis]
MILKGFKFGMLLQVAIGPVCLYIFSLGINGNFLQAQRGVFGVVLADAMYILLAILGISSFIKKDSVQNKFNILGAIIIIFFGMELFFGYFNVSFLPKINIFENLNSTSPFIKAFLLTGANPMTILFWIGVFSTKTTEISFTKKSIVLFAFGALLSSLLFLTLIAFLGSITNNFLSSNIIIILNSAVGLILIYFGIKKLTLLKT